MRNHKLLWIVGGLLVLFFLGHWLAKSALLRIAQAGLVAVAFLASGFTLGLRLLLWAIAAWAVGYSIGGPDWLYSWLPKNPQVSNFSLSTGK